MTNLPSAPAGSDLEFVVTRTFDAPRDLVFRVFTEADHIKQWWGPEHFSTPVCTVDFRVGGTWHYAMQSPDGERYWGKGVYTAIDRPRSFSYIDSFSDESGATVPPELPVTVALQESGKKTIVTSTVFFGTPEVRDQLLGMQMVEGWNSTWDCLEAYLATIQ